jgi:hypothetical protein
VNDAAKGLAVNRQQAALEAAFQVAALPPALS